MSLFITLVLMLKANGFGEMMGYLLGEGAAVAKTSHMEFRRRSYMKRGERLSRELKSIV